MGLVYAREPYHRLQTLAWSFVQLLETVVCQNAVLAGDTHQVRGNADRQQVQQGNQLGKWYPVTGGVGLDQLEADSAAAQVVEGVAAVLAFGVEHRRRVRQFVFRQMVVADYHVHAQPGGVCDLLSGLDAAVEHYHERETVLRGPVYALVGQAVTLIVAVRYVIVYAGAEFTKEGIYQSHGGGAVHVVVAVHKYLLAAGQGPVQTFDGGVHILHEKRIVESVQRRTEEGPRLLEVSNAPVYEQFCKHGVYAQFGA